MKKGTVLFVVAVFFLLNFSLTEAETIKYELDFQFSGDLKLPPGQSPWLTATFTDQGSEGSFKFVELKMAIPGISSANEYVSGWYFNYIGKAGLSFIYQGGIEDNPAKIETKADGAEGPFDIFFDFSDSQFGKDNTSTYIIAGDGISALSFFDTNTPGDFFTAAEIISKNGGGNGGGGIAWIAQKSGAQAVPEPATMLLLGVGLTGLAYFARKKFLK